jgi:excisionase family DNA binding protein
MSLDVSASIEFTTIPKLAERWCVSHAHIHNLIRQGALPAYRVGYRYIISQKDTEEFLARNATSSSARAVAA